MGQDYFRFELRGAMGLRQAGEFARGLHEAINAHPGVTVVAADLESVDFSIVQVLVAADKTARAAGKVVTLEASPGGALYGALRKLGLLASDGSTRSSEGQLWSGDAGKMKDEAA